MCGAQRGRNRALRDLERCRDPSVVEVGVVAEEEREALPLGQEREGAGELGVAAVRLVLGRLGQPSEVAQAVLMVLGNDYMTGQTIILNGGMAFI